jgi:tetratricopeptide (TPR) repeat protein
MPQYRRFLVNHLMNMARVNLKQKAPTAALAAGRRAEAELTELRRGDSERVADDWRLAELHRLVAQAYLDAGQKDDAVREATRLLDTAKRIYALTPDDRRAGEGVTGAFENLIDLQPPKAAEWREQKAAYWQEQSKARPDDLAAAVAMSTAYIERGELAVAEQEWTTALKWFEPARAELSARQNKHSADATVTAQLGYVLKWVGDMHWMLKNSTEATTAWTAAVAIYQQRLKATPDSPGLDSTIGGLLHNLGMADYQAGRKEEAVARFTEAIAHQSRSFARSPDESRRWMDNHLNLRATVLCDLRRWADAMADTTARAKLWPDRPDMLLDLAGHAAEFATAVGGTRADEWLATAVKWVAAALKHGAKRADVAADDRLASFRNRADFREALALPPVAQPLRDKK